MSSDISNTVEISNVSNQTSEDELRLFFGFWSVNHFSHGAQPGTDLFSGKISQLSIEDCNASTKSATITFDSDNAVKTACLMDNTQLDGRYIHVKPANTTTVVSEIFSRSSPGGYQVSQSEKPRTRILAEYLAYGYHISDLIVEKGIEFDKTNGISAGFQHALHEFDANFNVWDSKHHISEKAKHIDEKHQFLSHAKHAWNSMESYFEKALGTSKGLKLRHLYQEGDKSVHDVHNEARHLADIMKAKHHGHNEQPQYNGGNVECKCGSVAAYCPCPAGTCHCNNCAKKSGVIGTYEPVESTSKSISNGQGVVV